MTYQDDTFLSSTVSITGYLNLEKARDKEQIIKFIQERFTERYITPLRGNPKLKHGFCTMAICCLMIETLESFWRGWPKTDGPNELAFCSFFDRNPNLIVFKGYASDFYKNVRCGILHQAETTNGWLINRRKDSPLFDPKTKTINATLFHNEMENCLTYYCEMLRMSDWNSEIWINFRKKLKAIITHCKPTK